MFSVAHMKGKFMCKNGSGPTYTVANVIAFSIHVIEITYCKLTGKQRSVIKMRSLCDRAF